MGQLICCRFAQPIGLPTCQQINACQARELLNCGRLLDLILMKKDVLQVMLGDKLESLGLEVRIKDKLRATLASHVSYRQSMREPAMVDGVVVKVTDDLKDLTWMGALSNVGKMFFHHVEAGCSFVVLACLAFMVKFRCITFALDNVACSALF